MIKIIAILLPLLCIITTKIHAQNIEIEGQSIHSEGYVEYKLGNIPKGKKHSFWIAIKNNSDTPLRIISLELSCDCLSVSELPPMALPPGAKFNLNITHNAKNLGAFQTFALVKSTAQNYPELWIRVNGEVKAKVKSEKVKSRKSKVNVLD